MTATGLIWCSTRTATVGLVVAAGRVVDCPPYARRWAAGRDARQVWREQAAIGADLVWLTAPEVARHACGAPGDVGGNNPASRARATNDDAPPGDNPK